MQLKNFIINLSLALFSICFCLGIAEFCFRIVLFSDNPHFEFLRKPGLYADWDSDDNYWKLLYEFDSTHKPPSHPHPKLGWIINFGRKTYYHYKYRHLGNKRPVLLYGDSFAMCVKQSDCFQDILNSDTSFTNKNYLLNYGVGGYGVDQITLLCEATTKKYYKPLVILSLLTTDLDRSVLEVRTGQKPYYSFVNDKLTLSTDSIFKSSETYFKNNPPNISSYLYKKFEQSNWEEKEDDNREYKKKLNRKILLKTIDFLTKNDIEFVVLIFHRWPDINSETGGWRTQFIENLFIENNVPYISSRAVIRKDIFSKYDSITPDIYENYILKNDGHPTTLYNELISKEIHKTSTNSYVDIEDRVYFLNKRESMLFQNESSYYADYLIAKKQEILNDQSSMSQLKQQAKNADIELNVLIEKKANWLVFKDESKIE